MSEADFTRLKHLRYGDEDVKLMCLTVMAVVGADGLRDLFVNHCEVFDELLEAAESLVEQLPEP